MKLLVVTCAIDKYSTDTSLHGESLYHSEGLTDNSECGLPYRLLIDIEELQVKEQRVINHFDFKRHQSIGSRSRQENDNAVVQQPTICPQLPV